MTDGRIRTALVTNAIDYAGPPAVSALLAAGFTVLVHDTHFEDAERWLVFREQNPGAIWIQETDPQLLVKSAWEVTGRVDAIVSNDHFPAHQTSTVATSLQFFRDTLEALVVDPFSLLQAAAPMLKRQGGGNVVFVTSCRTRAPIAGAVVADAARAAANAMVKSLAVEFAADGVAINAVAPNFLYSEAYYPKSVFLESTRGLQYVLDHVPAQRLGKPEEIGELISFLAATSAKFLTGAVIDFSGGWPSMAPRPIE
ncbi:SDR family oxidoreductase [Cupriavidus sp. 8B]